MMEAFPERAFDVGIAEQHAVTLAAGMATQGAIVFCNIYSTFLQRAYDQVIHDVALQNLPVIFCLDRAGLVGEDGATHHGLFDLVYLRAIPNMIVVAPADEIELRQLLYTAQLGLTHPMAIRYPRGRGVNVNWQLPFKALEIGKAQKRFEKSLNKEKALEDKFNISMKIPSIYRVGREEDNFVWIDRQIQKGNMNIIAYTMPWDSFKNDSTFVQDIVKMRDSIGGLYIGGEDVPGKKNHMITEKAFSPYVFPAEVSGKKAAEVRGIWEMSAYPMAGPFLTYIINDKENNRKLVLEGFVFAPATKKRDYMFELEAILKSVQFNVGDQKN
mgnify:CR=1 FL=1